MNAATSKVENSAQGLSCLLKFVHGLCYSIDSNNVNPTKKIFLLLLKEQGKKIISKKWSSLHKRD
jgi:hypothetical protein